MSELSREQSVQEEQYNYPYHYIPQYRDGFTTALFYGYGINYASTLEFLISKLEHIEFKSLCDIGAGDSNPFVRQNNYELWVCFVSDCL